MPKIIIEMERIANLNCGLGQFCYHLGRHLLATGHKGLDTTFLLPKKKNLVFGPDAQVREISPFYKYCRLLAPKADIWHVTHQDSPFLPPGSRIPVILTIHDLNFLYKNNKSSSWKKRRMKVLQKKVDRAHLVVTVSRFTEQVVRKYLSLNNTPVHVIYNGVVDPEVLSPVAPATTPDVPFIFSIGNILEKKNFLVLIDLLARLKDYHLVVAGPVVDEGYMKKIRQKAIKLGVGNRLIMPGAISEREKHWYFDNCSAFVFPSLAEGFGIPVVEAMRFGKPVFLSQYTSLPEVGGTEAFYFDHFDSDHMLEIFEKGMDDYGKAPEQKAARLRDWSRRFCWTNAAQKYIDLYCSL